MKRTERYPSRYFIPELIEDQDIIFSEDSEYHKQKKKEKKNPIFKRNKPKKFWGVGRMTVEQFLKSLSELMWVSYWSVVFYKCFKSKK